MVLPSSQSFWRSCLPLPPLGGAAVPHFWKELRGGPSSSSPFFHVVLLALLLLTFWVGLLGLFLLLVLLPSSPPFEWCCFTEKSSSTRPKGGGGEEAATPETGEEKYSTTERRRRKSTPPKERSQATPTSLLTIVRLSRLCPSASYSSTLLLSSSDFGPIKRKSPHTHLWNCLFNFFLFFFQNTPKYVLIQNIITISSLYKTVNIPKIKNFYK